MLSLRTFIEKIGLSAAIVTAAACNGSDIVGPHDLARLARAQARWDARPFADYSYETRRLCFCPVEITRWTRVSVRNGVVVAADPVEPDPGVPIMTLSWWTTIDSLFDDLFRSMTESSSYLESIEAEYDPELGFPTSIEYTAKSNIADGSSSISVRNVRPLD
jgi:hypothetical protein